VHDEFTALGSSLVTVSPLLAEPAKGLIEQHRLGFDILRDAGNEVATGYGLRWTLPEDLKQLYLQFGIDLAAVNGDESWTLPLSSRYRIDGEGIIRDAQIGHDYTIRPDPEETLARLRELIGG